MASSSLAYVPEVQLTAEEEADLLAIYGTHNPFYDELLDVQAPSQYRSIYESRNLFLTADDDNSAHHAAAASTNDVNLDALDYLGPLDLFVLRHLNGGSSVARPSSYSDALTLAVESLDARRFTNSPHAAALLEQCRNAVSHVEEGLNIKWGTHQELGDPNDDADAFDKELQQLISDAESEINRRNFHYDPATDAEFQERLRKLQERELTPLNDEAFEDDGELLDAAEIAAIEMSATERCQLAPLLLPEEAEELAKLRLIDETNALKKVRMMEMNKIHLDAIEKRGDEERKVFRESNSIASVADTMEGILQRIQTIDQRDAESQEQAKTEVRRVEAATEGKAPDDYYREHQQGATSKGLVVFNDFAKKIDAFIPPSAVVEPSEPEPSQALKGDAAIAQRSKPKQTLQALRKASARAEMLAKLEARERRHMRDEEERINAHLRNVEAQIVTHSNERDAMKSSEDVKRRATLGEEAVAHVEILVREERQRSNLLQLLQQRQMHHRAMVISELSDAFDQMRTSIINVEGYEWTDMSSSERSERQALITHAQQVEEMLRDMEKAMVVEQQESMRASWVSLLETSKITSDAVALAAQTVDAYGDRYPSAFELIALQRLAQVDCCGFGSRCEQLVAAVATKAQWTQSCKNETVVALQALSIALHQALIGTKSVKRAKSIRASPPPTSRTPTPTMPATASREHSAPDAASVCLNDHLVRKLIPLQFAAASLDVVRAPQVFQSLSFALESVDTIDFQSVSTLYVQSHENVAAANNNGAKQVASVFEAERFRIAPYVKSLDLSSNSIQTVDVDALMDAFPSISSLYLSSNQLRTIESAKQASAFPTVTSLDVSANALAHLRLGVFPNLRKVLAFTNKLVDLSTVTLGAASLHEVEMSRNAIESVAGVNQLPILGTLDLSRNRLTAIDELRSSIMLQKLFLSCNKIAQFPSGGCLLFLRQLFLNENTLTEVPECVTWLPMLSDLHLESNAIRTIAGLRCCQQLVTLKLAFNQLGNGVDDIRCLSACKRLRSLSLNDNPMMQIPSIRDEVDMFVMVAFPLIREWNTDTVTKHQLDRAHLQHQLSGASFVSGLVGMSFMEFRNAPVKHGRMLHRSATALSTSSVCHSMSPAGIRATLSKAPIAIAQDFMFERLQREHDTLRLFGQRKYQQALSQEENFKTRVKERGGYLLGSLFMQSDSIEQRNYVASLQQSQKHLETLRETVTLDTHMNTHIVSLSYEKRARVHKEAQAKRKLSEWIIGRLLIRKAVFMLETLREASEIGRQRRVLRAVLRIQPLWRGALIRKRLRLVRQMEEDDDDELFQKVSFEQPDLRPIGFSNFNTLLQGAMLSHPQAPKFNVKALASISTGGDTFGRVGSAPTMTTDATPQRPQSNPIPPRAGMSASQAETFTPAKTARSQLDDEWGSALADQLRKKQAKMDKAKQSAMRKEYLNDPLRAKKLMGGK